VSSSSCDYDKDFHIDWGRRGGGGAGHTQERQKAERQKAEKVQQKSQNADRTKGRQDKRLFL